MRPRSLFHLRSLTAAVLTVLTVAVPAGAAAPGAATTQAIVALELREVPFKLSQQAYVPAQAGAGRTGLSAVAGAARAQALRRSHRRRQGSARRRRMERVRPAACWWRPVR